MTRETLIANLDAQREQCRKSAEAYFKVLAALGRAAKRLNADRQKYRAMSAQIDSFDAAQMQTESEKYSAYVQKKLAHLPVEKQLGSDFSNMTESEKREAGKSWAQIAFEARVAEEKKNLRAQQKKLLPKGSRKRKA